MPFRLGPGPVFGVELVAASRRWQSYALRAVVVTIILMALWLVILNYRGDFLIGVTSQTLSLADYARVGSVFVNTILLTQLVLILLVAPAATAGAICIDKARGNLTLLMASDMSVAEIVLGKLFARLLPVLILVATSLPVLFIIMLMGGVNFDQLILGFIVLVGTAIFCCALALWLSMYVGKTHEALLLVYFAILIWLAAYPVIGYLGPPGPITAARLAQLNPFVLIIEPSSPLFGVSVFDYQVFLLVTCGWASVSVLFSIWRLRRVVLSQENRPRKRQRQRMRASYAYLLSRNPLLWYERHRRRPSKAGRAIWMLYLLICIASVTYVVIQGLFFNVIDDTPAMVGSLIVTVGLLLATVNAVTALADERTRGSLDILLLTPVRSRSVLWAKWRSAFGLVMRLTIVPVMIAVMVWLFMPIPSQPWRVFADYDPTAFPIATLATLVFCICAAGALLTSVGLMIATWVKNVARSVGLAVGLFVFVTFLLPVMVWMVFPRQFDMQGVALLSPSYAVYELMRLIGRFEYYHRFDDHLLFVACAMACVDIIFAIFFYVLAWIAFDRKMGRISRDKPVAVKDRTIWMKPVFGRSLRDVVE